VREPDELLRRILRLSEEERRHLWRSLRGTFVLHPIETRLNASAEAILEAISRASPLTIRGIEGIIAEASFATETVPQLPAWRLLDCPPGEAYDFKLTDRDDAGAIRLQVKMQRRKEHRPLRAHEVYKTTRGWPADLLVVEVQRTRSGKKKSGEKSRPYRFGEFDVLAVSLGASKGKWAHFVYTVADWLIPNPTDSKLVLTYQPASPIRNEYWTDSFEEAAEWLRSGARRTIPG
jgi:hypothetical protein